MQFATSLRNARLAAIATAAGSGATLRVYTGTSPGVGNSPTGTLLSTLMGVTFGSPSGGSMEVSSTADPLAAASGTPGYCRLATAGGTALIDLTAGVGSGECSFSVAIALGGTVTEVAFTIPEGNA